MISQQDTTSNRGARDVGAAEEAAVATVTEPITLRSWQAAFWIVLAVVLPTMLGVGARALTASADLGAFGLDVALPGELPRLGVDRARDGLNLASPRVLGGVGLALGALYIGRMLDRLRA
jgi:hypothetical protein